MSSRSTSRQTVSSSGDRVGLVRRLLQHRGEAEKLAVARLVDHDFLVIFIDGGDLDRARNHDVGLPARVADLVDPLARGESLQFDLRGQHRRLVVVEQREQRNMFQFLSVASHGPPRS